MVAVVTGTGVGLVNSSRDLLGGVGELGNAVSGRAGERVSVNAADGNLVVQDRDEYLVGIGPDVDLLRTYNSLATWDGDNNDNWRIGYYRRVVGSNGAASISRIEADGHVASYVYDASANQYTGTEGSGQYDVLRWNGSGWTWTDGDTGVTETYTLDSSASYRLAEIKDPEGHRVSVAYTGSLITQLATFKSGSASADEWVTLNYSGTQLGSVITSYKDTAGASKTRGLTSYGYLNGRLQTVTTDLTPADSTDNATKPETLYTVSYGYDANGRLQTISQKDGSSVTIGYDGNGRVLTIQDEQGRSTGFGYDTVNRITTVTTSAGALSQVSSLKYGAAGELLEVAGAAAGGGSLKQSYSYDASGNVLGATNPANQPTLYDYSGGNGAWTRRTDAAGNITERSYDASTHLLLSETVYSGPGATGPRKTLYFYDISAGHRRLAHVLGPQGQVTRYTYNSLGQLQRQVQYTSARFVDPNPSFASLEAWANGPQAQATAIQVIEYSYDLRGQVLEERRYALESAAPAPAPAPAPDPKDPPSVPGPLPPPPGGVDGFRTAGANGPEETPAATSEPGYATAAAAPSPAPAVIESGLVRISTTYDAFGRLVSRLNHDGYGTTFTYDGLNRVTTSIDAALAVTTYSYDDAGRKTSIKLDNGLTTVQIFDTQGRLVSSDVLGAVSQAGLGATQYFYDKLGLLRRVQDATGVSTYTLYDTSGRSSASIAANGQLTEYFYDAAGRLIQSVAYANLLTASQLSGLTDSSTVASVRPAGDTSNDRIITRYYDPAGRLTGTLDADGYLVENQYDGSSALVAQVRYATVQGVTRLDVSKGTTQANAPTLTRPALDTVNDRTTRKLYNASGQLAAQVDGEGGLTLWTYDAAGNLLSQLRRSALLSGAQRTGAQLAELQALSPLADDEFSQWVYDNAGRQVAQLDAEGLLTEYQYDSVGRAAATIRYLSQAFKPVVSGSPVSLRLFQSSDLTASLRSTLGSPKAPLITRKSYNSRGLLETETAADGSLSFYSYDNLQRLKTSTQAKGSTDERGQTLGYDDWGRLNFTQTVGDATGITTTFDAAGRRKSVTDARGKTTWFYCDAQGRQQYAILKTVNATGGAVGEVTETLYSGFSDVKASVTHAKTLDLANLSLTGGMADASLTSKIAALTDANDNVRNVLYNRRGLVQQAVDALGARTDTRYNAFGEVATVDSDVDLGANPRRLTLTDSYDRRGLVTQVSRNGSGLATAVTSQAKFDALGRLSLTVDELNQPTITTYLRNSGTGRQVTVAGPAGSSTTTYDALDRVLTRRDRNGNTVIYGYDDVNRKFTVKTAEGIETSTETNRFGLTVKVTDGTPAPPTVYAYDTHGNLLSITDALGNVTQNIYDLNDNLIQVIQGLKSNGAAAPTNDGSASTTVYSYDAANRVLTQTVDSGGASLQTRFQYDGQGRRLQITDPRGTITSQSFTARGDLKDVVVDATGLALKTSYSVDAQGRVLTVTEGAGTTAARKTAYEYDVLGRRTAQVLDPDGLKLKTRYQYDAAGHLLVQRDNAGQVAARYRYDTAGRLQDSIDAMGAVTRNVYDGEGRLTAVLGFANRLTAGWDTKTDAELGTATAALAGANDPQSLRIYDKDGRQTFSINPVGEATQFLYDPAGRVIETVRFATRLSGYSASSNFSALTQAIASSADLHAYTAYDDIGRVQFSVDASGAVSEFAYDRQSHVTRQRQYATRLTLPVAGGADIRTRVAAAGFASTANDRVTDFAYDSAGRQRFLLDAEGYVSETRYDDANGLTTTLRYTNRFSGAAVYTPATIPVTTASFTSTLLTSLGNAITVSRGLDRAGRQSTVTDGNTVTQLTTYDAAGRVQTEVAASGRAEQSTTFYKYDSAGRLTDKILAYGTAQASTSRYDYDSLGRLWHATDPRGVALAEGTGVWEQSERVRRGYPADLSTLSGTALINARAALLAAYTTETQYDAAGRVKAVIDPLGGITSTQYDAFGNAIQLTDARGFVRYQAFDKAGRLNQSIDAERYLTVYNYDPFGNLKTTLRVDARVQGSLVAGQAVQVVSSAPANGSYVITSAGVDHLDSKDYDRANRLLRETDAENYVEGTADALTGMNAFGQRLSVRNKLGAAVSYTYDRLGRLLTETLPVKAKDGQGVLQIVVNEYQYDSRGNRVVSIEAKGLPEQRTTQMRYDGANRLTLRIGMAYTATAADGSATPNTATTTPADLLRYDALGRLIEQISHGQLQGDGITVLNGRRSVAWYDALGQKALEISADRVASSFVFDSAGNQVVQTIYATRIADAIALNPLGAAPGITQDLANDRTLRTRYDALSRKIEISLDALYVWDSSQPISNLKPLNTVLQQLFYDAVGNLTERKDGRGNSSFEYFDGIGRRLLAIDAGGAATAWAYGRAGRVATKETRYAAMLPGGYIRQANGQAQLSAANDPVQITALVASLLLNPGDQHRVTTYALDRLDRVTEKRILDVAQDQVDASGTRTQSVNDAITQYQYNGLGAVTQIRELAAQIGATQTWEQTDLQYDELNREIDRKAPSFIDYLGNPVRPTTDIEYDGLGNVVRRLQRGTDNSTEADDRITVNKYVAGLLVQITDAAKAVTQYAYDSLGNVARRTTVGAHRSDDSTRDLVKLYQYDAAGRIIIQIDLDTGERRKTRYNAFGEISAQGLGDGWEEFAEYSTLGKVSKTNSGDGAIKFYVYDANGNQTRELRGNGDPKATDLRTMSLETASSSNQVYYRVSVYNSRNLLIKTIDPRMDYLASLDTLKSLYQQQWVPAWAPANPLIDSADLLPNGTVQTAIVTSGANKIPYLYLSAPGSAYTLVTGAYFHTPWEGDGFVTAYAPGNPPTPGAAIPINLSDFKGKGACTLVYTTYRFGSGHYNQPLAKGRIEVTVAADGSAVIVNPLPRQDVDRRQALVRFPADPTNTGADTWYHLWVTVDGTTTDLGNSFSIYRTDYPDLDDVTADLSAYRPASGSKRIEIKYVKNFTQDSGTLALDFYSSGLLQNAAVLPDPRSQPVGFYVKGRNIPYATLYVNGASYSLTGSYTPPAFYSNGSVPGYTYFMFDAKDIAVNGGIYNFGLQLLDRQGQPLRDELGNLLNQSGRFYFDPSNGNLPIVQEQITEIVSYGGTTITQTQNWNAFGEVNDEHDERVVERMTALRFARFSWNCATRGKRP